MFASYRPSRSSFSWRVRYGLWCACAALAALGSLAPVEAAPVCRPDVKIRGVSFSPMDFETMQRRWTATISVDAAGCATQSGLFQIRFEQLKETAPDTSFAESFTWTAGVSTVSLDFAADESVAAYQIERIASCPCRKAEPRTGGSQ